MIIAIDGPSGAGKSTLGKMLANQKDLLYLDTGAMYRAVGLAVLLAGANPRNHEEVLEIAEDSEIELIWTADDQRVKLNGINVTQQIRSNEVAQMASLVSTIADVRNLLVERQQELAEAAKKGAVLDGRDIGTVVCPKADFKFFITADAESRARRRYEEESGKGKKVTLKKTLEDINRRDQRDTTRKDSPLVKADDAFEIDTSSLTADQVLEEMLAKIDGKSKA